MIILKSRLQNAVNLEQSSLPCPGAALTQYLDKVVSILFPAKYLITCHFSDKIFYFFKVQYFTIVCFIYLATIWEYNVTKMHLVSVILLKFI